jgi:hypothetical protein
MVIHPDDGDRDPGNVFELNNDMAECPRRY